VIRELVAEGFLRDETRPLASGASIHLLWHKGYRYYKRAAKKLVDLVNEYADPAVSAVVGLQGEMMVLEGFARCQFLLKGRNTNEYGGKKWGRSKRDLDFIFERDSLSYGVEVKNTLGYMDEEEFREKIEICHFLGIQAVFAARMLPRTWIYELSEKECGFALILKHQLYPWGLRHLARRVSRELKLPVDSPTALQEGTMKRFMDWHQGKL